MCKYIQIVSTKLNLCKKITWKQVLRKVGCPAPHWHSSQWSACLIHCENVKYKTILPISPISVRHHLYSPHNRNKIISLSICSFIFLYLICILKVFGFFWTLIICFFCIQKNKEQSSANGNSKWRESGRSKLIYSAVIICCLCDFYN